MRARRLVASGRSEPQVGSRLHKRAGAQARYWPTAKTDENKSDRFAPRIGASLLKNRINNRKEENSTVAGSADPTDRWRTGRPTGSSR